MRQGTLLGHFLCDRVQGVERFAAHLRHFPSQVPPPRVSAIRLSVMNIAKQATAETFYADTRAEAEQYSYDILKN